MARPARRLAFSLADLRLVLRTAKQINQFYSSASASIKSTIQFPTRRQAQDLHLSNFAHAHEAFRWRQAASRVRLRARRVILTVAVERPQVRRCMSGRGTRRGWNPRLSAISEKADYLALDGTMWKSINPKSVSWMSHAEARRGRERRERYHYQVELKLCRE